MAAQPNWERLAVVGVTGSGKTTLARRLAHHFQVPHVELDALYWGPGWTASPGEVFRERITQALNGNAWVVDGNYGQARDLVWRSATHLIWLDYAWPVIFGRILRRTVHRLLTRQELWNGNREHWREAFLSRDSLFVWALKSRPKHRRQYPELLAQPEYAHLQVVRLSSPRATQRWLAEVVGPAITR